MKSYVILSTRGRWDRDIIGLVDVGASDNPVEKFDEYVSLKHKDIAQTLKSVNSVRELINDLELNIAISTKFKLSRAVVVGVVDEYLDNDLPVYLQSFKSEGPICVVLGERID